MPKPLFSKTSYIKGLQCLKALYLYKKYPALREPLSATRKERFDLGHRIGIKARDLYPNGIDASPRTPSAYKESQALTQRLVALQTPAIYEACFIHDSILVYCDLLIHEQGKWKLAEVKSSDSVSPVYKNDLALQYYVLCGAGIPLSSAVLITLQTKASDKVLESSAVEIFLETDFTDYCQSRLPDIADEITQMKTMLAMRKLPALAMGEHCKNPYPCEFTAFCSSGNQLMREGLFSVRDNNENQQNLH